jgi:hypothetical protein
MHMYVYASRGMDGFARHDAHMLARIQSCITGMLAVCWHWLCLALSPKCLCVIYIVTLIYCDALGSPSCHGRSKRGRQRFFGAENAGPECRAWRGVAATSDATSRCPLIHFVQQNKTKLLGEGSPKLALSLAAVP